MHWRREWMPGTLGFMLYKGEKQPRSVPETTLLDVFSRKIMATN
jgi:hypothetical protein